VKDAEKTLQISGEFFQGCGEHRFRKGIGRGGVFANQAIGFRQERGNPGKEIRRLCGNGGGGRLGDKRPKPPCRLAQDGCCFPEFPEAFGIPPGLIGVAFPREPAISLSDLLLGK
jgi:hypothetical protein